jgi:hypothetical protein
MKKRFWLNFQPKAHKYTKALFPLRQAKPFAKETVPFYSALFPQGSTLKVS